MARPTITKRFELSEAAVAELERRVAESGYKSQTAYVEALLQPGTYASLIRATELCSFADSTPEAQRLTDVYPNGVLLGGSGRVLAEGATGMQNDGRVPGTIDTRPRSARLCEHNVQPANCKYAKCRKT